MPTARTLRLNELLQRELSGLLRQEHQAETVTVTITSVDVAPDLRSCKIFVAVTGDDEAVEDRLRWLRRQAAAMRATLSRRIVLKHLPALTFIPDTATLRGNRILAVLDDIAAKAKPGAPGAAPAPAGPDGEGAEPDSPVKAPTLIYPGFAPRFAALLASLPPGRLVVIGHARPDGDCIGAQVALARMLRGRGREVLCANPDPVPRRLHFCVGDTPFVRGVDLPDGAWTALFVDCADLARAGDRLAKRFPTPYAAFDHHLSNPGFATHNFVDPDSAATCEILAGLFTDQGLDIDGTTASALYTGIATDTGQFRFHSTTHRTFLLAAMLVEAGARPADAAAELYERESRGKLQLLERFLASLQYECGGRVCVGVLPAGSYEATGTQPEDTEGMVDYARGIDGVDIGVLIEERAGGIKASLRAKDPACRVDRVAARFGGGGHACAAGLNLAGVAPAEFRARLLAALADQLAAVDAAGTQNT